MFCAQTLWENLQTPSWIYGDGTRREEQGGWNERGREAEKEGRGRLKFDPHCKILCMLMTLEMRY